MQTQCETRPNGSVGRFRYDRLNSSPFISEENEAVFKMIIKGKSLTMRHVSRTLRVALDWSIYRINLDPKIQIEYFGTRNQFADILTKSTFTRDGWHHFLRFFNIVDNSVFFRSHLSNRIDELLVMSKRQM